MSSRFNKPVATIINAVLFWILFLLLLVSTGVITAMLPQSLARLGYGVLGTLAALLITWAFLKHRRETFGQNGLRPVAGTLRRFVEGLVIGVVIFGLMLSVLLIFTDLRLQEAKYPISVPALIVCIAVFFLSLMEEIAFRGYPFTSLDRRYGLRITQVIVATAFALYHFAGGQDILISFLGPGIWAFVFGLAAAWSGGIAKPLGIHVAMNLLQLFFGMKGDDGSLVKLDYEGVATTEQVAATNQVGIIMQVSILVFAVMLMEYYLRKGSIRPLNTAGGQIGQDHKILR